MKAKVLSVLIFAVAVTAHAGSATWSLNPTNGDWNTAANWTPQTVPNGPSDIATFGLSNATALSLSSAAEVNGIVFESGASGFTVSITEHVLTISGVGLTNDSGTTQQFVTSGSPNGPIFGEIDFTNGATAGDRNVFINDGAMDSNGNAGHTIFKHSSSAGSSSFINNGSLINLFNRGTTEFHDTSTADQGTFVVNNRGFTAFYDNSTAGESVFTINGGTTAGDSGGQVDFFDSSTAANSTFTINGGDVFGANTGVLFFLGNATAGSGTFISNGSPASNSPNGIVLFVNTASAGSATLIAQGGAGSTIYPSFTFRDDSLGGTAVVKVYDWGELDISSHNPPGVTIGSLEGDGYVGLGANNLSIGANNYDTTYSGKMGVIPGGGSVTKIGRGRLILRGASDYSGGTMVQKGTLGVANLTGSATGSGPVEINAGSLGGDGTIAGATTVGTGSGTGATLAPALGQRKQRALNIQSALTLQTDATYICSFLSQNGKFRSDSVVANGITISGANFSLIGSGPDAVPVGTVFTVIKNTAATPISGTFANLPDGGIITVGSDNFQANYTGGDGNDLTFTVVP